jgi:PAS domain S-box-containing protein
MNRLRRRLRGLPHAAMITALQDALDDLDVCAVAADNSGRYVAANARASELTGFSRTELLAMTVKDLTPAIWQDASADLWHQFIQTGAQAGDYRLERKDGGSVLVHYAAYASVAPGVHVSVLTPRDVPSPL